MDVRAKTARKNIGKVSLPKCYQWILKAFNRNQAEGKRLLDFGCGFGQAQEALEQLGFDYYGCDLENRGQQSKWFNSQDAYQHGQVFDVVVMSNVLNVQANEEQVLDAVRGGVVCLKDEGVLVYNYPDKPRKSNLSVPQIEALVKQVTVDEVNAMRGRGFTIYEVFVL